MRSWFRLARHGRELSRHGSIAPLARGSVGFVRMTSTIWESIMPMLLLPFCLTHILVNSWTILSVSHWSSLVGVSRRLRSFILMSMDGLAKASWSRRLVSLYLSSNITDRKVVSWSVSMGQRDCAVRGAKGVVGRVRREGCDDPASCPGRIKTGPCYPPIIRRVLTRTIQSKVVPASAGEN